MTTAEDSREEILSIMSALERVSLLPRPLLGVLERERVRPDDEDFLRQVTEPLEEVTMHYDLNDPVGLARRYAIFFKTLISEGLDGYEAFKLTKTLISAENRIERVQIPMEGDS